MTNDDRRCETCDYWEEIPKQQLGQVWGNCRRHAPAPLRLGELITNDRLHPDYWCGEWSHKRDKPRSCCTCAAYDGKQCHRHAPIALQELNITVWPEPKPDDWCMEWVK